MFEFVRSHQKIMQFLLLLLIVPSFLVVGVLDGYSRSSDEKDAVAKIAGKTISQQEWDYAQREQMNRFREMYGSRFDPKMLETPEAKQNVLENLLAEQALKVEAERSKLAATPQQVQAIMLANFPDLGEASLSKEERVKRYNAYAQQRGMTVGAFEARVRETLLLQTVNSAIQATAFTPKTVANRISDLSEQEREVQELQFKAADFVSKVNLTEEMLKEYYDKNGKEFEIPEMVNAEYVVLSNDALVSQVSVTDEDIKAYYDQNAQRYTTQEQRRASHILVEVKKGASSADKAAAKAEAESLLAQVRKNPSDFAKLAKESSDDKSSGERGGDLEFFSRGNLAAKQVDDAAYKLAKPGDIADLVESDFGFHIVQLTDVKPVATRALEDVKAEIVGEIKAQQIAKKYSEMAEIFTNTVYEQADSLKPVAEKLNLKIETASNVTSQPNPNLSPAVQYNSPKFLAALFSDEAIKNKRNTEAVEIGPNTLIAGHVIEHKPASKRPFADVKEILRGRVIQLEAVKLAKKAGEDKLAGLKAKDDAAGFAAAEAVTRMNSRSLEPSAASAAMKADTSKLPAYVGVELPGKGYSVLRISKVSQPANPDKTRRESEQQQLAEILSQQEMLAYVDLLKHKAKAQILKPLPAKTEAKDDAPAGAAAPAK